jgi:hypothetical protein
MKNKLCSILLGMMLTQPVWAEWTVTGTMSDKSIGEWTSYADLASISKTDNGRKMFVLWDYKLPQGDPKNKSQYKSEKALEEYDCSSKRLRSLTDTIYSGQMGSGKVVDSNTNPSEWKSPSVGSPANADIEIVCGYLELPKQTGSVDWMKTKTYSAGKIEVTVFLDYGSLRQTENGRSVWILWNFKGAFQVPENGRSYKSQRLFIEYDCAGKRERTLGSVAYSEKMGGGAPVWLSSDPAEWQSTLNEGLGADTMQNACSYTISR